MTTPNQNIIKRSIAFEKKYRILITRIWLLGLTLFTLYSRWDIQSTKIELAQTKSKLKEVETLNKTLVNGVAYYNNGFKYFPLPSWKKKKVGNRFIGSFFNKPYVEAFGNAFGYNGNNLIGKDNFHLGYPYHIAYKFYKNDSIIAVTGKPQRFLENYLDSLNRLRELDVLKWRELRDSDTLVNGSVLEFFPYKN